jgi:hypothetical protein
MLASPVSFYRSLFSESRYSTLDSAHPEYDQKAKRPPIVGARLSG